MAKRTARTKRAPARKANKRATKMGILTNFARMVSAERQRLQTTLQDALGRRSAIDREIAGIQHELNAMSAFFSTKLGKSARGIAKRAPRGQKRQQIVDLIKTAPEGLTRGEIIQRLNAVEKSAQQSVSNALSALYKSKALKRDGRRYRAV